MTDHRTFTDAILANPGDTRPRLIYADYLDERGDPRGGWLRASVNLTPAEGDCPPVVEALPLLPCQRRRRLFAVACCRQLDYSGHPSRVACLRAIVTAELFACGLIGGDEMSAAGAAAYDSDADDYDAYAADAAHAYTAAAWAARTADARAWAAATDAYAPNTTPAVFTAYAARAAAAVAAARSVQARLLSAVVALNLPKLTETHR